MPTTNLSISSPSHFQIDFEGWSEEQKSALAEAIIGTSGVTKYLLAGAGFSAHVYYDPNVVEMSDLILMIDNVADEIMPGQNFVGR